MLGRRRPEKANRRKAISSASDHGTSIVRHRDERHSRRYSFRGTLRACPMFSLIFNVLRESCTDAVLSLCAPGAQKTADQLASASCQDVIDTCRKLRRRRSFRKGFHADLMRNLALALTRTMQRVRGLPAGVCRACIDWYRWQEAMSTSNESPRDLLDSKQRGRAGIGPRSNTGIPGSPLDSMDPHALLEDNVSDNLVTVRHKRENE